LCIAHVTTMLLSNVVYLWMCAVMMVAVGVTALTCRRPSVPLRAVAAAVGGLNNPQTPSSGQPATQWGNMTCFQPAIPHQTSLIPQPI